MYLLLLPFLLLMGCATVQPSAYDECWAIANAYQLSETRGQFMRQCVAMTPGPVPTYGATGNAYQPDPFGPYGYRGPTWEQFNNQFQQPNQTIIPR